MWCGRHGRRAADRASAAGRQRLPVRLSSDAPLTTSVGRSGLSSLRWAATSAGRRRGCGRRFGVGEGGPVGIGEDPTGLVGEGHAHVLLRSGGRLWLVVRGWGGLLASRLEAAEGFLSCYRLLFLSALFVPFAGGVGQVHGGGDQSDGESARCAGRVGELFGGLVQRGGGLMIGAGGGAAGAGERRCRRLQFCLVGPVAALYVSALSSAARASIRSSWFSATRPQSLRCGSTRIWGREKKTAPGP